MPIIPWRPFRDLEHFFEEAGEPGLRRFPKAFQPPMDIYEQNGNLVAKVELPGIDPKKVDVSIQDNVLRVEGKEEKKREEKKKGYYYKEIKKGAFKRVAVLPVKVQETKAKAVFEDGVLKITIPKVKGKRPRKGKKVSIKVKK